MSQTIEARDGVVTVSEWRGGRRRISVAPKAGVRASVRSCETDYSDELISLIIRNKGSAHLCDEILRDQSPDYVARAIENAVLSYIDPDASIGKRLLDFGCGHGASSMHIARARPNLEIVGVELRAPSLDVARARARHYQLDRVEFHHAQDPASAPTQLGTFDYVLMSAVFEHLLPNERRTILPQLFGLLKPGGLMFINQTPHRYFPIEWHTTGGIPLINYLPDKAALHAARLLSKKVAPVATWPELLRDGIRGASEGEILAIIRGAGFTVAKAYPDRADLGDDISLWYASTSLHGGRRTKKILLAFCRALKALTGLSIVPSLAMALRRGDARP